MLYKIVKSTVGGDGTLHLDLALGALEANKEVQVTIESARPILTQDEWEAAVLATAGSIPDPTFQRQPQPPLEEREPLS